MADYDNYKHKALRGETPQLQLEFKAGPRRANVTTAHSYSYNKPTAA